MVGSPTLDREPVSRLPIRLARPSIDLTLIESNIKKCTFLKEVSRKLGR